MLAAKWPTLCCLPGSAPSLTPANPSLFHFSPLGQMVRDVHSQLCSGSASILQILQRAHSCDRTPARHRCSRCKPLLSDLSKSSFTPLCAVVDLGRKIVIYWPGVPALNFTSKKDAWSFPSPQTTAQKQCHTPNPTFLSFKNNTKPTPGCALSP